MGSEQFSHRPLVDLIPEDVLRQIVSLRVVESGFGAGPGFVAVKRWTHDPPIPLLKAMGELEAHRDRLRRCHVCFTDGSSFMLDRHQFLSFHPSVSLRRKRAGKMGAGDIIRARFRFSDYDEWPQTLATHITEFIQIHSVAPNLLAASREVYVEMDRVAQSKRTMVVDATGKHPGEGEQFGISAFVTDECEVEFVLTEATLEPEYLLIYDREPEFDGEPAIVPGTNVVAKVRAAG